MMDSNTPAGPEVGPLRRAVTAAAVVLAVAGLLSLAGVLAGAVQGTIPPVLVAGAYLCLPLAFLLMVALLIAAVRNRRRQPGPGAGTDLHRVHVNAERPETTL